MSNQFLSTEPIDTETAILLDKAYQIDIGKAIAYTNGETKKIFINTDDNLYRLLPNYDDVDMCKWLLWHERLHNELNHPIRFQEYVKDIEAKILRGEESDLNVSMQEVNIIMDILVHDKEAKMFPELVPVALENLAQFRNRNSLSYTFTTYTLEEMIDEYRAFKKTLPPENKDSEGTPEKTDDKDTDKSSTSTSTSTSEGDDGMGTASKDDESSSDGDTSDTSTSDKSDSEQKAGTGAGGKGTKDTEAPEETVAPRQEPEHDKTDWSKLEEIESTEFIDEYQVQRYIDKIEKLRKTRIKLARLTKTLHGLVTDKTNRTYSLPSYTMSVVSAGTGLIFKGKQKTKASLYLCFDASGSMGGNLALFKEIITRSIPQAMNCPCDWFTDEYKHGTYRDMLDIYAESGFNDDGDRVLELCYKAEQQGYTPVGVTDGGGGVYGTRISYEEIKSLKRTVIVTNSSWWADRLRDINKNIQIINIADDKI
jgi:hypothetical protein